MARDNLSGDWRAVQKQQTRQRIVRAVHELVAESGHVSVPRVAERSGVSPATIYRYFPSRDDLIGAAAYEHVDIGLRRSDVPITLDEYRHVVRKVFAAHEDDLPSVIAAHSTPAGRQMRQVRAENRRAIVRTAVTSAGIDPDSPPGRRLVAVMTVIASSRSFLEFHEMTDLSTEEAADATTWAIEAVLHATLTGRELDDLED